MAPTATQVIEDASQQAQFPHQHHQITEFTEAHVENQDLEFMLPTGFALLSKYQSQRIVLSEAHVGNQAPELLLSSGFVLPHLQQLQ
jgi:hypothetical protein